MQATVNGCQIDSTEIHQFLSNRKVVMFDCNNLTTAMLIVDFFTLHYKKKLIL